MTKFSLKHKADLLYSDFFTLAKRSNLVCKAVRKTLHYSQATMAQKLHYGAMYVSDFENDIPLRPEVISGIYKGYSEIVYNQYSKLDDQDYILWCLRVVSNYATVSHEHDYHDDDELVKKFILKFAELYPEYQ